MNTREVRIDFLKGLAFILVFAVHVVQYINNLPSVIRFACFYGQTGVQLFLVCSGILYAKFCRFDGVKSHLRTLKKRYFQLIPLYAGAALLYLGLNQIFAYKDLVVPFSNNTTIPAWFVNMLLLHGFFPFANNNIVPGGWYLGAYFAMLITAPVFLLMYERVKNKDHFFLKAGIVISIFLALISGICLYVFGFAWDNGDFVYFSFITQYPAFLIGIELGTLRTESKTHKPWWYHFLVCLLFTLLSGMCFILGRSWCYALVPLLTAISYSQLYHLLSSKPVWEIISNFWILGFIGKNSYVAYLLSFVFAWYIPILVRHMFLFDGIVLLCVSWGIMLLLLPVSSVYVTHLQSRFSKWLIRRKI